MARKIYDLDQVLNGLGATFRDPQSDEAFKHDTFAHLVARIKHPDSGINDSDSLVFLGKKEDVVHAIIARGNHILADRQIDQLRIPSEYRREHGQYITKLASGLKTSYILSVVEEVPLQEFYYQQGLQQRPPPPVVHDFTTS